MLKREVTKERLASHFAAMGTGPVELWALDNILALKIVLNSALQGGAARSLRMDNLGKNVDVDYYVCSVCGMTVEKEAPEKCPVCGAAKKAFFKVA